MKLIPLIALLALGCAPLGTTQPTLEPLAMSHYTDGDVTVHSLVAGRTGAGAATHIVETPNALIIFDPQQFPKYGRAVRRYANSLNKPISHVIITHARPDHIGGLEAFADRDTYALRTTRAQVGESRIDHILNPGECRIDGVLFHFDEVLLGHEPLLVARVPAARTMILQDLFYHGYATPKPHLADRVAQLTALAQQPGYAHFLAGHGGLANSAVLSDALATLTATARTRRTVAGL
jgi:glyoxylase-like metal-dependent hydrolase (beta-lactamase superfamily II)